MKNIILLLSTIILSQFCKAQSLAINTDGSTANTSAILDVKSTAKGILIPRMDSLQRATIPTPATGLLVYQTNKDSGFYFYDGTAWLQLISPGNNLWKKNGLHIHNTNTGNVGIGISNPLARLQVADSSVLFSATGNVPVTPGNVPLSGAGRRMMWYPAKAAFRTGYVTGNNWDKDSIGQYSFAAGFDPAAKGFSSIALGSMTNARGDFALSAGSNSFAEGLGSISLGNNSFATNMYSLTIGAGDSATTPTAMAIGNYSNATGFSAIAIGNASNARGSSSLSIGTALTATGLQATAIGFNATASGENSIAMTNANASGNNSFAVGSSTASGVYATSFGESTIASGLNSTAFGNSTTASGINAIAIGYSTNATGNHSTAMGYGSTASGLRSMVIGNNVSATGDYSFAIGNGSTASGFNSIALGNGVAIASGESALATGSQTNASGRYSTSMNYFTTAKALGGFSIGTHNETTDSPDPNVAALTDRVFQIGVGDGNPTDGKKNAITVLRNGNTGFGTFSPAAKLDVSSISFFGLTGTAMSNSIRVQAGSLASTAGSEISIASLGFLASGTDNTALGIRAYRTTAGTGFTTTALLLGYDVNNTVRAAGAGTGFIALNGNGNIGIGLIDAAEKLDVLGKTKTTNLQVTNGAAVGKVLTSDAVGNANWADVPAPATYWSASGNNIYNNNTGNVGIGTTNPLARLHVTDSSVLFSAAGNVPVTPANVPISNAGRRMMWYPEKAAFRVGYVDGVNWNKDSIGNYSFASGYDTRAKGNYSTSIGSNTTATGDRATSIGFFTTASGTAATSMGSSTTASGIAATSMGSSTTASGNIATSMGYITTASGSNATSMGYTTAASGNTATSLGAFTIASGDYTTSMGYQTTASGLRATSMGYQTTAGGEAATSMGYQTTTSAIAATSMGFSTIASGIASTSMGSFTTASGLYATSMGTLSVANGNTSTSMGYQTTASGVRATSMGDRSVASGNSSTSMGSFTNARSANSLVIGIYNDTTNTNRLFEIGNGTANNARSNALTVLSNGNMGIVTTNPLYRLDLANGSFAFGNSNSRTETRDNAGLQGNAGAQSGFFETSVPVNFPSGANSWWHLIDSRHSNSANNYSMQIAGSFFDQELWFRKTNSSASTAWSRLLSSGNLNSYGWSTTGNSGTNSTNNFIGTTDGNDFVLRTSNIERMRITAAGNVGIGTPTANAALQLGNTTAARKIVLYDAANNDNEFSGFGLENDKVRYQIASTAGNHVFFAGVNNTTSNELMRIQGNGNVGIGTANPAKKTEIIGAASATPVTLVIGNRGGFGPAAMEFVSDYGLGSQWRPGYIRSNDVGGFTGAVEVYTNGTGAGNLYGNVKGLEVRNGVTYTATGTVSSFSDERIKNNVKPFTNGLDIINKINPVSFYYNQQSPFQTDKMQVGILAQELEKVAPYMVDKNVTQDFNDLRSVNNQAYIFLLINAVKEQSKKMEQQQKQIDEQRKMIDELLKK